VKSLRCLRLGGRILTCGATAGYSPTEDLRFIWTFELEIKGSNGWERDDITKLFDLVAAKKLQVLIDKTYPLEEAKEAVRVIEDRAVFGKVVVTP
jgi:alcohol dehydrogenase